MTDPNSSLPSESRRSFVKKSVATSMSIPLAGLIRAAHGATTLPYGSTDPWGDNTEVTDPWDDDNSGITIDLSEIDDFTLPTEVTVDPWSWWSIDPIITETNPGFPPPCDPGMHDPVDVPKPNGTFFRYCRKCGYPC